MQIGMFGLGMMKANMVRRLIRKGYTFESVCAPPKPSFK